jgi:hypothetical protein
MKGSKKTSYNNDLGVVHKAQTTAPSITVKALNEEKGFLFIFFSWKIRVTIPLLLSQ